MAIPCVIMRGGTSKCVMFHAHHLPADPTLRDQVLLAVMGSPDPRQIDGLGGASSTTSKVCIVGPPSVAGADVDFTFAQVSIHQALVDYKSNCGNCSSAVGPFAVDEGLVRPVEPITTVRIHNTNTGKIIRAEVPVRNGRFDPEGTTTISGVPTPGSRVALWFDDPVGSTTGRLLPTGRPRDMVAVPGVGTVPLSIVDAATLAVFVQAEDVGVTGTESPAALDGDPAFLARIEAVRGMAAALCGLVADWRMAASVSPSVPKVALVARPQTYADLTGAPIPAAEMDLLARIMSMQTCHRAYALTGAVATCAAAFIPGTVVHALVPGSVHETRRLRLGHPSGTLALEAIVATGATGPEIRSVSAVRTARRIMEGQVHIPAALAARLPASPLAEVAAGATESEPPSA
jgi:2-methylaconitate cis-trans-isomerase PrpF